MRIECPGCAAAYEVPEAASRPGRDVQCARCAMRWQPFGGVPPAEPPPLVVALPPIAPPHASSPEATSPVAGASEPALRQRSPASPATSVPTPTKLPPAGSGAPWGIAWAASLSGLAASLAALTHWRNAVMLGWPATARIYHLLGSTLPPSTLH